MSEKKNIENVERSLKRTRRSPEPGFGRGGLLMFGLSMISSLAGTSMGSSVGSHMRRDVS